MRCALALVAMVALPAASRAAGPEAAVGSRAGNGPLAPHPGPPVFLELSLEPTGVRASCTASSRSSGVARVRRSPGARARRGCASGAPAAGRARPSSVAFGWMGSRPPRVGRRSRCWGRSRGPTARSRPSRSSSSWAEPSRRTRSRSSGCASRPTRAGALPRCPSTSAPRDPSTTWCWCLRSRPGHGTRRPSEASTSRPPRGQRGARVGPPVRGCLAAPRRGWRPGRHGRPRRRPHRSRRRASACSLAWWTLRPTRIAVLAGRCASTARGAPAACLRGVRRDD